MEIKREDIKDVWDKTRNEIDRFKITFEKPYKYSIWLTNSCLGLLGFYIAVLLQIKGNSPLDRKFEILTILIIIIIPIAFGIFFRFKYEVIDTYDSVKRFFHQIKLFLEAADKKFKEKGVVIIDEKGIEEFNISWDFIEEWSKKPIFWGILLQFLFFILGLFFVIIFLLRYLLC